ncbi:hypothetical protein HYT84_03145 [Candidatus Micrarchaeota archaeon]|nr:hypothetical protein [Candidatus Micrarchaeota archaeon]
MNIILTKHAKEKMVICGISKEQIIRTIQQGAKVKQTDGYLASHAYIKVAYKQLGEEYYKIKTVFIK